MKNIETDYLTRWIHSLELFKNHYKEGLVTEEEFKSYVEAELDHIERLRKRV